MEPLAPRRLVINYFAMRTAFILCLLFVCGTRSFAQTDLPEFERNFYKNFKVPGYFRTNCENYFACVIAFTDSDQKIVNVEIKNKFPKEMSSQFDFLKGYQFPAKYSLKNRPVMFFLTIDNTNYCDGRNITVSSAVNSINEIFNIASTQLNREPETLVIYKPFITKTAKPWR